MKRFMLLVILAAALFVAAKPGTQSAGLTSGGGYPFTYGSYHDGCFGEDDQAIAYFYGTLVAGEIHSVTIPLCDASQYPWGPGGLALRVQASANGNPSLLATIASPSGVVYSATGRTWGDYTVRCASPVIHIEGTTQWSESLPEGGVWTMSLKNTGAHTARNVNLNYAAHMAYYWALPSCPASDLTVV